MIGIYKITNPKGRLYIGQSVSIEKRRQDYRRLDCRDQRKLYNSLVKYGFSEHIFEIIEKCTIEQLNERERHWQDFYNVLEEGLNCRLTEASDKSGKLSQETVDRISTVKRAFYNTPEGILCRERQVESTDYEARSKKAYKKVLQYTTDGTLVKIWESVKDIVGTQKIAQSAISNCLTGRQKSARGFIWMYRADMVDSSIVVGSVGYSLHMKGVRQYNKEGIAICEWESVKEAADSLRIHPSGITHCLAGRQKTAGGFLWK